MNNRKWASMGFLGMLAVMLAGTGASPVQAAPAADGGLVLFEHGYTRHRVVVAQDRPKVVDLAAQELVDHLERMSGVKLAIVTDAEPATDHEILLGATNRLSLADLPADVHPKTKDGFVLHRKGQSLAILGKINRGVLYGVYDFLEQELGVRFLNADHTYVPRLGEVSVKLTTRTFDPPFEYRQLIYTPGPWSVRSRLNGSIYYKSIAKEAAGTFFVGRFVHTMGQLLPTKEYFDSHPEYFALIDGKRTPMVGGSSGQPCMSHPEVMRIILANARKWLDDYKARPNFDVDDDPIISISANDNNNVCACDRCTAINEEEGTRGGTMMRLVNFVAEHLEKDYPTVRVETLGYGPLSDPPKKSRPHPHVIIRFAPISSDFLKPYSDPEANKQLIEHLNIWKDLAPSLYTWNYQTNFHNFYKPFPDLEHLGDNVRFLQANNLKGYFSEGSYCRRATFRELRNYILARTLLRPDLDSRALLEEYCQLSYGPAAAHIIAYIDDIHAHAKSQGRPLRWNDASLPDGGIQYDFAYLLKLDGMLEKALAAAPDEVVKQRIVNEYRQGVWYQLIAMGLTGQVGGSTPLPLEWKFRKDPDNTGQARKWQDKTGFDDWDDIRVDTFWTHQDVGKGYHGSAWYALTFDIAADQAGFVDLLQFGSVDGRYELYLDGKEISARQTPPAETWNIPFIVRLDEPLKAGRHTLVMRVTKEHAAAGIWQPVMLKDSRRSLPAEVIEAAHRYVEIAAADPELTKLAAIHGPRHERIVDFISRVQAMLKENEAAASSDLPAGSVRQPAALLANAHKTFSIVESNASATGQVARQTADRRWTHGQSIRWRIADHVKAGHEAGRTFKLKVRLRRTQPSGDGPGFSFGYATVNQNWSGSHVDRMAVQAQDMPGDQWQWYTLDKPVKLVEAARGMVAYVEVPDNPQGVGAIEIDAFLLEAQP